jgi:hypothetical protein
VKTGVGFLPMTLGIIVAAGLSSRYVGKIGVRIPLLIGPAMAVIGMLWISRITPTSAYLSILGPLIVIALGMGFTFVPITLVAVSGVEANEAGLASALLNTMQQVGGALGLAVLATVAIDATNSKLAALGRHAPNATNIATTHGCLWSRRVLPSLGFSCPFSSFVFPRSRATSRRPLRLWRSVIRDATDGHSESGRLLFH